MLPAVYLAMTQHAHDQRYNILYSWCTLAYMYMYVCCIIRENKHTPPPPPTPPQSKLPSPTPPLPISAPKSCKGVFYTNVRPPRSLHHNSVLYMYWVSTDAYVYASRSTYADVHTYRGRHCRLDCRCMLSVHKSGTRHIPGIFCTNSE